MTASRPFPWIAAAALIFAASARVSAQTPVMTAGLSFGQIIPGDRPGTIRVSASGSRITAGSTYAGSGMGVSAASFTIPAPQDFARSTAWSVMLPASATLTSGKSEMTMDGFEYTWGPAGPGQGHTSGTLMIGATLHVGANQPSADYSGSFALTVAYQ